MPGLKLSPKALKLMDMLSDEICYPTEEKEDAAGQMSTKDLNLLTNLRAYQDQLGECYFRANSVCGNCGDVVRDAFKRGQKASVQPTRVLEYQKFHKQVIELFWREYLMSLVGRITRHFVLIVTIVQHV